MNPKHNLGLFVALAFFMVVGLASILISAFGMADNSRHIAWSLLGIVLSPLPIFVGHRIALASSQSGIGSAVPGEGPSPPLEFGFFLGAAVMTSALVWPVFTWHLDWYKNWKAAAVSTAGIVVVLATGAVYHAVFNAADEDETVI